jgi:hypothetical protein
MSYLCAHTHSATNHALKSLVGSRAVLALLAAHHIFHISRIKVKAISYVWLGTLKNLKKNIRTASVPA